MKGRTILGLVSVLLVLVSVSCLVSEASWSVRRNSPDAQRQLIGLPSEAVGNLNPSARNPGLELFCPALNDIPGGYCYYFTAGVPVTNLTINTNMTVSGNR